jgi:hypothetical protein
VLPSELAIIYDGDPLKAVGASDLIDRNAWPLRAIGLWALSRTRAIASARYA